jgi:predicted nucleic acid-binding protein
MKGIADTGFVVAFRNRTDEHHRWAVDLARRVTEPLLTCESVLSEASFQIGSSEAVLELIDDGLLQVAFDLEENREQLRELAVRFADRRPDLADLCLIRMSELYPHHTIITVDADFRVYRRNKREAIPLLTPPKMKK